MFDYITLVAFVLSCFVGLWMFLHMLQYEIVRVLLKCAVLYLGVCGFGMVWFALFVYVEVIAPVVHLFS